MEFPSPSRTPSTSRTSLPPEGTSLSREVSRSTTLPWSRSSARPAPSFSSRPTWKSSTSERRAELSRRSGLESLRFDSQSLRLERGPRRRVNAGLRPWPSPPSSSYQTKAAPIRSGREAAASFLSGGGQAFPHSQQHDSRGSAARRASPFIQAPDPFGGQLRALRRHRAL